ncbi:hypothetical protein, conserved [Angomonas deanei]|uniref:CCR4-NOT transcription complex subunit 10 n=1 Tax=Angomonas deanei TaxID=59799 RepID=A0A7G2C0B7_9TRYP|nr:hypothetical protein, conserved [Angomonas deanei]
MSDEKSLLDAAKKAFDNGNFSEAEKSLKSLPQDDPQAQHNLAVVQYLKRDIDAEEALNRLGGDSAKDFTDRFKSRVLLRYEGHETALYNKAALLANSGLFHEAITLLRGILVMWKDISKSVVAHALCLFQSLTRPSSSLSQQTRLKSDDELIQAILARNPDFAKSDEFKSIIAAAFADSDSLHEVFKGKEGEKQKAVYLNDLGVLLLNNGKSNVASLCFAKAEKSTSDKQFSVKTPLSYNTGLCALLRGNYDEAIRNFLSIQDAMKKSPIFWLRFSEAAVNCALNLSKDRSRQEYEQEQDYFRRELSAGKLLANFEFLILPGAHVVPGPTQQETSKEHAACAAMEQLAASAIQNALFLLIPQGYTYATAVEAFHHNEQITTHAMLSWVALEVMRKNYSVAVEVGQQVLSAHSHRPLNASVHTALLCYLVEALVQLNDADRAMKVLRQTSLSQLVSSSTEKLDSAHRCRVETLFINLTVTHILNGSWTQAHSIMESLLIKMMESQPASATDFRPEREVQFACQILGIFLELAQGNREKAAETLSRLSWAL